MGSLTTVQRYHIFLRSGLVLLDSLVSYTDLVEFNLKSGGFLGLWTSTLVIYKTCIILLFISFVV